MSYTGNVKHPGNFDYIKEGRGHNVCLAVSKDGVTLDSKQCLLTNRDYPAGLTCHVRDPKVFAYEGRYYMVLGARTLAFGRNIGSPRPTRSSTINRFMSFPIFL